MHLRIGKQIIYEEHENNYVQMTMFSYKVMPAAFLTCTRSFMKSSPYVKNTAFGNIMPRIRLMIRTLLVPQTN